MSRWSTLALAITDVRTIMNDGAKDKIAYRKKVVGGPLNGSNKTFKTFERRRVTTFVTPTGPEGVFVDYALATVDSEDLESGEFTLHTAPNDGQDLVATYYYQWFTDAEMTSFLNDASAWIMNGTTDPTTLADNMVSAAREYAASLGYQKLAAKFAQAAAEQYQLSDAPDPKNVNPAISEYTKLAKLKMDLAFKIRDDVYDGRQGRGKAPRTGVISGSVRDVPPNR